MIYTGTYHLVVGVDTRLVMTCSDTAEQGARELAALQAIAVRNGLDGERYKLVEITGRRPALGSYLYFCQHCGKRVASRGVVEVGGGKSHLICWQRSLEGQR